MIKEKRGKKGAGEMILYLQKNMGRSIKKPKKVGEGYLSFNKPGEAYFFDKDKHVPLAKLVKAEVLSISTDAIFLNGFESVAIDEKGKEHFEYQEWFCSMSTTTPETN
ncbi:MAG: hypothetical protein ACOZAL_01200 [Patescibacteria group bacterium]